MIIARTPTKRERQIGFAVTIIIMLIVGFFSFKSVLGDTLIFSEDFETSGDFNGSVWNIGSSTNTSIWKDYHVIPSSSAKKTGSYGAYMWYNQTDFAGISYVDIWNNVTYFEQQNYNSSFWRIDFDMKVVTYDFNTSDTEVDGINILKVGDNDDEFSFWLYLTNQSDSDTSFGVALRYYNYTWDYAYERYDYNAVTVGNWYNFKCELLMTNSTTGYYKVWLNDVKILDTGLIATKPFLNEAEYWNDIILGMLPYKYYAEVGVYYDNLNIYSNPYSSEFDWSWLIYVFYGIIFLAIVSFAIYIKVDGGK